MMKMFGFVLEVLHFPRDLLVLLPTFTIAKERREGSSQRTPWSRFAEWLCFQVSNGDIRCLHLVLFYIVAKHAGL